MGFTIGDVGAEGAGVASLVGVDWVDSDPRRDEGRVSFCVELDSRRCELFRRPHPTFLLPAALSLRNASSSISLFARAI